MYIPFTLCNVGRHGVQDLQEVLGCDAEIPLEVIMTFPPQLLHESVVLPVNQPPLDPWFDPATPGSALRAGLPLFLLLKC